MIRLRPIRLLLMLVLGIGRIFRGSDPPPPKPKGTFTARLTGAVTDAFEGSSGGGALGRNGERGYLIALHADGRCIDLFTATPPRAGRFALHPHTFGRHPEGYWALYVAVGGDPKYLSIGGGTVEIAEGADGRLAGTFRFDVREHPKTDGPTATVTGSFTT